MLGELIHSVLVFLEGLGYWGIMLGLMLEVIPSEIVLSYAGYLVSTGSITFWGAVAFGTIGGVIAQLFIYWIGRYGGRPVLERYGKYILIQKNILIMLKRGLIVTELVLFLQRVLFLLCVMLFRYQQGLQKCHMLSLLR